MTNISAAFDLGLKRTGIAWRGDSDVFVCPPPLHRSPMDDIRISARLNWWMECFEMALLPHAGSPVAVEGPFIHPKHINGAMRLVELHGAFRVAAHRAGCPVTLVSPSELKQWATGRGNAGKAEMVERAVELGCGSNDDNEADAFLLFAMLSTTERVVLERTDEGQRGFAG